MFPVFKLTVLFLFAMLPQFSREEEVGFIYNGFEGADLKLNGIANITATGILMLTNATIRQEGHVFYRTPIHFLDPSSSSSSGGAAAALSFPTTFVFTIVSDYPDLSGHGIAFVIAPTIGLPGGLPSQFIGLFNSTNIGSSSNHVFAVELDTVQDFEFKDINNNHVGVDINGLKSIASTPAS